MSVSSNSSQTPTFICDNLLVAATLRAAGHRVAVAPVGPNQVVFQVFDSNATDVARVVRGFYSGEPVAAPLMFERARAELRHELDRALGRRGQR